MTPDPLVAKVQQLTKELLEQELKTEAAKDAANELAKRLSASNHQHDRLLARIDTMEAALTEIAEIAEASEQAQLYAMLARRALDPPDTAA